MAAAIVISLIAWYFCKRRRTGDDHFSALFRIALSEFRFNKLMQSFSFFISFNSLFGIAAMAL